MKFKENLTGQSGITLIALIITIIVLVILVAVSVKAVYDSKIIKYTVNGAQGYSKEAVIENKLLDNTAIMLDSETDKIYNIGSAVDPGSTANPDPITKPIIPEKIGTAINSENYGKKVTGYTSQNGIEDWRLFYQDENYTYIIIDGLTSTKYKPSDYYSSYKTGADVGEAGQNLNGMLKSKKTFFTTSNKNPNIIAIALLTDIDMWSEYTDSAGKAEFAIASPTLELFVKSYNATASVNGATSITLGTDEYGYTINAASGYSPIYNNGIYNYSSSATWWIASPSYGNPNYDFHVYGLDTAIYRTSTTNSYSVRPVVCFQDSVFQENYNLS